MDGLFFVFFFHTLLFTFNINAVEEIEKYCSYFEKLIFLNFHFFQVIFKILYVNLMKM